MLVVDRPVEDLPLELEIGGVVRGPGSVYDGLRRWKVDGLKDWLDDRLWRRVHSLS